MKLKKNTQDFVKYLVTNSTVNINNDCWIWNKAINKDGYGRAGAFGKSITAHRLSYLVFKGEIPPDKSVCHTCDAPYYINPNHLFLATNVENIKDKINKGRQIRGERVKNSKLSEEDVKDIRNRYPKESARYLSKTYNVAVRTIYDILYRHTWNHV
jgi:hypothetical protein